MTSISSINTVDGNLMANALSSNATTADPASATGATGPTTGTTATAGSTGSTGTNANGLAALSDPTTFLKLLMTELENQDPSSPMSDTTLMNQTSALTQVEAIDTLNQTITQEASTAATQSATSMIGMYVTGADASGNPVTGQVTSVSIDPTNGPSLNVGNTNIAVSSVTQVGITAPTS